MVSGPLGTIYWVHVYWGTKIPLCKQVVFASLTVLFFLLAAYDFTGSVLLGHIAGFEGILCGLSAIYFAMA